MKKFVGNISGNDPNDDRGNFINDEHDFSVGIYLPYELACKGNTREPQPRDKDCRTCKYNFVYSGIVKRAGANDSNRIHYGVRI
ncbi:hypothetical protein GCM10008013_34070 [Paenibacillus segetis]|uniref:Uncharacterized protein n=1 Tax=Paenibacillus segetis TaxID=1325360 RepID=A0ABQ1YLQ2_9BACL|nr:hypothetical protein GCM10008013_34070 [Paenibacillus segetis]